MAGTIVIASTFMVAIEMQSGSQPVVNVIGIRAVPADVELVAENVKNAWEVTGGPLKLRPTALTMTGYRVTDLRSPTGPVFFLPSTTAGGVSGQIATNAAAALISYSGGTRSRSSSGRLYHGPLGEGQIETDGRTLAASYRPMLDTAYRTFQNTLATDGYQWVVISRKLQEAFKAGLPTAQNIIGTQRRRIRGR